LACSQLAENSPNLALGFRLSTGVVDQIVRRADLFFFRPLCGHSALQFFACSCFVHLVAGHPALDANLQGAGHDKDAAELGLQIRFENQRGLDHDDRFGMFAGDVGHPFALSLRYGRMNDGVEFLNPIARTLQRAKGRIGQLLSIDGCVRTENLASEVAKDFFIDRLAGTSQVVGDLIRLGHVRTKRGEHLADGGFPAANRSGEPNLERSCQKLPRGLKPYSSLYPCGTAEAVP